MDLGTALIGLLVLVYGGLAVLAARRPLLARLAFREAVRRPWQSALIVLVGFIPALQASRLAPSEALRLVD